MFYLVSSSGKDELDCGGFFLRKRRVGPRIWTKGSRWHKCVSRTQCLRRRSDADNGSNFG
ncbi:hypothetical protein Csa_020711 [Cucumis sativus]|uniref:Uncharacterized protein n=1 Tax=Cucumis sativus TaxID=3659 RepID=A0A0A0KB25_CUCSA|nr:hypothetical protein Csa_020711 [Cucumis sativus]